MKKRIVAAWKVLRGECVAHPPVKPSLTFEPTYTNTTASTLTTVYWKVKP